MKAKKIAGIALTVFGSLFLFMGLIFLVIFLAVGGSMSSVQEQTQSDLEEFIDSGAIACEGEVIEVDSTTSIEYYVEEEEAFYIMEYSVTNSSYDEGTSVTVYYDPDDPGQAIAPELLEGTYSFLGGIFSVIGGVLGVIFGLAGGGMLIGGIVLIRKAKKS